MFIVRKKTTEKPDSLAEYNIIGSLSGLGPGILIHALHEMRDPADAQAFLTSIRAIGRVLRHPLFQWSISQIVSETHRLTAIPPEKVDLEEVTSFVLDHLHVNDARLSITLDDILSVVIAGMASFRCLW